MTNRTTVILNFQNYFIKGVLEVFRILGNFLAVMGIDENDTFELVFIIFGF